MGWVDSDFAGDPDTRKSVTGYVCSLNNGPIAWKAKRQSCVTLSSTEAEFVAASICRQEIIYLQSTLRGFGYAQKATTILYEDNASCIAMSNNQVNPAGSCHINTRLYFLHDMVWEGVLKLTKVNCTKNVADALTKSVPFPVLAKHSEYLLGTRTLFQAFFASVGFTGAAAAAA
eukprot:1046843-Rhodomonas_salina.1